MEYNTPADEPSSANQKFGVVYVTKVLASLPELSEIKAKYTLTKQLYDTYAPHPDICVPLTHDCITPYDIRDCSGTPVIMDPGLEIAYDDPAKELFVTLGSVVDFTEENEGFTPLFKEGTINGQVGSFEAYSSERPIFVVPYEACNGLRTLTLSAALLCLGQEAISEAIELNPQRCQSYITAARIVLGHA